MDILIEAVRPQIGEIPASIGPHGDTPPCPPLSPLTMPVQRLSARPPAPEHTLPRQRRVAWVRLLLVTATLLVTGLLGYEMWEVLSVGQLTAIELVMLVLFVSNIAWIAFGSVSTVLGMLLPGPRLPAGDGRLTRRTALLMPTYNEDPARVVGAATATLRALAEHEHGGAFDFFILSDTNRSDVWLAEQSLVDCARADPQVASRLFYRHRLRNRARKSGNIADWVERWGGAYDFMLVLDADSLMEAEAVIELARRIEADPHAGIVQTIPRLIGAETPLARLQQFAARVYGPAQGKGFRTWFGDAGNYWGHNAIIRTAAFAAAAGLPDLPGGPPFGGHILSHDFVEAALIRRAGYAVRLADDLAGSFEHGPPNLIELAQRDRRWCQGNLQHSRVLSAAGLHPLSRLHLVTGIMSYLASPMWLVFLLAGMLLALHASLVPPDYFTDEWSLFPTWPMIDAERAITLFGLCMLVLFVPKLVGLAEFLRDPAARGSRLRAVISFPVEVLFSALIAPIAMMAQTRGVYQILTGGDSGWNVQVRGAVRLPLRIFWRVHHNDMLVGIVLAVAAGAISWSLLAWMSPALAGLVLAIPVSAFVGSPVAGRLMRRMGLLATPEDRTPPAIAAAAAREAERLAASQRPARDLAALLADPRALQRHLRWLDAHTARHPGERDPALASALLKFADGLGAASLDAAESYAVLATARTLETLSARAAPAAGYGIG